jgi:hypothetical protein
MNYKIKYLKYKQKYILLKKKYYMIGGDKNEVYTKKNTGKINKYSNQCMWISILDYFQSKNSNITIDEIRSVASSYNTPINNIDEMFDMDLHRESLQNISNVFNLQINIYPNVGGYHKSAINTDIYTKIIPINEINSECIRIISFGAHFELITNDNNDNNSFNPDISLAFGIEKKFKSNIEIEDLLSKISDIEIQIVTTVKQIDDITNELNSYILIKSFPDQTNIQELQKEIDSCSKLINYLKNQKDELDKTKKSFINKLNSLLAN